jgi:uncharacterized protein (TIGR01777 family)
MKIILPGGSGRLGRLLTRAFTREGHECVLLTRDPARLSADLASAGLTAAARAVAWDGRRLGPWAAELEGADALINLAGRDVNCRYGPRQLAEMRASRIDSTRILGAALAATRRPPGVWLQASTATIYAHRHDAPNDEITGLLGGAETDAPARWRTSVELALAWERELFAAKVPGVRRVALRTAIVMGAGRGGPFDALASLCRLGLGAQGDGRQFVSWIHEHDFVSALRFLLGPDAPEGPINLAAPLPLPNRDFVAAIHAALGPRRPPLFLPAPAWLLEIGAFLRRTETELLLKSRRVTPARLLAAGYRFQFPAWPAAAAELVGRWRRPGTQTP